MDKQRCAQGGLLLFLSVSLYQGFLSQNLCFTRKEGKRNDHPFFSTTETAITWTLM